MKTVETLLYSFDELPREAADRVLQGVLLRVSGLAQLGYYSDEDRLRMLHEIEQTLKDMKNSQYYKDGKKYEE